jgi:hypothetical protein
MAMKKGVAISPQDGREFDDYRSLLLPSAAAARLEGLAKWVFGGTTALTAILATWSVAKVASSGPVGKVGAAIALALMALAMALASFSLRPVWSGYHLYSLAALRVEFAATLRTRQNCITGAVVVLSLSLLCAGATPAVAWAVDRASRQPQIVATASYEPRTVVVGVVARDLKPQAPIDLVARDAKGAVIAAAAKVCDASGSLAFEMKIAATTSVSATEPLVVTIRSGNMVVARRLPEGASAAQTKTGQEPTSRAAARDFADGGLK